MIAGSLNRARIAVEAAPRPRPGGSNASPAALYRLYGSLQPLLRRVFGKRTAAGLILLDHLLSPRDRNYGAIVCTIRKSRSPDRRKRRVRALELTSFAVPEHRLGGHLGVAR
jgi:hypothetical protein